GLTTVHGLDCGVAATIYLAWNDWYRGRAEEALTLQERAVAEARGLGGPPTPAFTCCYAAAGRPFPPGPAPGRPPGAAAGQAGRGSGERGRGVRLRAVDRALGDGARLGAGAGGRCGRPGPPAPGDRRLVRDRRPLRSVLLPHAVRRRPADGGGPGGGDGSGA